MKMVSEEIISGTPNPGQKDPSPPSPTPNAIGTEFARQYYTLLVESPASVHRFYSHESTLLVNDVTYVGQQKIGQAIEGIVQDKNRKIKIASIKGVATVNQGIALQVFGQMGTRRFSQTFILAQQGEKKYYVQNDLFYFMDHVFKTPADATPSPPAETEKAPAVNGHSVPNGVPSTTAAPAQETPSPKQARPAAQPKTAEVPAPAPASKQTNGEVSKHEEKKPAPVEVKKAEPAAPAPVKEEPKPAPPAPAPQPVIDNTPKTWAKLVGGGSKGAVTTAPPAPPTPKADPPPPKAGPSPAKPTQPAPAPAQANRTQPLSGQADLERRIYMGAIVRKRVPESTTVAEEQIKEALSAFGEVETVAMPRKVLDQPSDQGRYAFAFITMKSFADAQNVFKAARKDDRGNGFAMLLPIKVDAFGFDGEVQISEQKADRDRPGGFRGGRGGFMPRGGFVPRGRGGGRGGFRGGYNNQGYNQTAAAQH